MNERKKKPIDWQKQTKNCIKRFELIPLLIVSEEE